MALTIAANRGHRKQKSFYRTSKISGFSVVRATSSAVIAPSSLQGREFAKSITVHPSRHSQDSPLFSFDSSVGAIDLLDLKPGEIEPTKISVSPESLERAAWFSSLSSDEESDEDDEGKEESQLQLEEDTPNLLALTDTFEEKVKVQSLIARINSQENLKTTPSPVIVDHVECSSVEEQTPIQTVVDVDKSDEDLAKNRIEKEEISKVLQSSVTILLESDNKKEVSERRSLEVYEFDDNPVSDVIGKKEVVEPEEDSSDDESEGEDESENESKQGAEIVQAIRHCNVTPQKFSDSETSTMYEEDGEECMLNEEAWEQYESQQSMSAQICSNLSADIEDMVAWLDEQHENSGFVRHENSRLLRLCVKASLGEGVNVVEYGSSATGLALPDSDLDFVVVLEKRSNAFTLNRASQIEYLSKVADALAKETWVHKLTFVQTAGIPVIKFDGIGGRSVDLSCLGLHHHGLRTQHMVQDHLAAKPHLKPLVLVLKQLVKDHGVGDKASGGVSSYALFLLVTCFLCWHDAMMMQNPSQEVSVGWVLLAFLEQHSAMLDYRALVFTVNGYSPRSMEWDHMAGDFMAVVDPFDPQRNVTRGLYRLSQFSAVLRNVWVTLCQGQRLSTVVNTRPVTLPSRTSWKANTVTAEDSNQ